ncbi:MAG: hypothetical protein ACI4NG_05600 [Candidatus Gallimonas sp.]
MLEFLSPRLKEAVRHVNLNRLYELRIRTDKPLRANFGGTFVWLGENGVTLSPSTALVPTAEEVEETLFAASGYSVYAVENQLRRGFVTGKFGERIGVAGSVVYENGGVLSVHSITSLCVRIPHEIKGCAAEIFERCFDNGICSLVVASPPGMGKTTILRDLSRLVSERYAVNILVSDERGELSAGDTGATSDVVRFADKLTAFTEGIRAMRPDVIVTDELLPEDYRAVERARKSGIVVFASAHLVDAEDVPHGLFDRCVLLDGLGRIGKICRGADDVA